MPDDARTRITAVINVADVPLSVRDIAHFAHVSPSTAHRTVSALAHAGRVQVRRRRGDPRLYVERAHGRARPRQTKSVEARLDEFDASSGPVWVLRQTSISKYGIHRRVGPLVLIAERWVERVDLTGIRYATVKHTRPIELSWDLPAVEVFIAMLQVDPRAAKEMWDAGALKTTDPRRLRRRIRAEQLEGAAAAAGVVMDRRRRAQP